MGQGKDTATRIAAAIAAVGTEVTLEAEGKSYSYRAVLSTAGAEKYTEGEQNTFGAMDKSYASYYGPVAGGGEHIAEDSVICCGTVRYSVRRREIIRQNGVPMYIWAMLTREAGGQLG